MDVRKQILTLVMIAAVACVGMKVHAGEVLKRGYQAGQWTQDYDAAMAAAKKSGIPVLLNFTGSDWCGYCHKMDEAVFSKPEWKQYAKTDVALAYIDFPKKDKSKVPAAFVARNKELAQKHGIRGYPTYVLLDSANGEELGRLGYLQGPPANFIAKVNELKMFSEANLKKLSANDTALKTAVDGYLATKAEQASLKDKLDAADKKEQKLREELDELLAQSKAKKLGARGAAYLAARKELKAAKEELKAWMATSPQRNSETMKKYQALKKKIDDAAAKVSSF